jgi:amino acid adenylation domain-containing protein
VRLVDEAETARFGANEHPPSVEQTLVGQFQHQAILYGSRMAVGGGSWQATYTELNAAANHLAHRLLASDGAAGDRIALLMRHDTPLVAAAISVLKVSRIVVVLNPTDPPSRLHQVLNDAEPSLIVTDPAKCDLAEQIAGRRRLVLWSDDFLGGQPEPNLDYPTSPDHIAFLIYTSGSTGRPKGVMQTHRNVVNNVLRLSRGMVLVPEDRITLLASPSGGHGVATLTCSLLNGAALYPFPIMDQGLGGLAEWLREQQITVLPLSTSVFRHFINTLAADACFPSVRLIRLGSEPATSDDFAAIQRHFAEDCVCLHTLSSSETGNVAQLRLTRNDRVAPGRLPVGRPVEGIQIFLQDEYGRDAVEGQSGQIVVKSRYLSPGYWRNPTLTAERFAKPNRGDEIRTFYSGDLGRRTADGLLVFEGRNDARIKIHGYRVEPSEVEDALVSQPGVEEAVVLGIEHKDGDNRLVGYIRYKAGHELSEGALRVALRAALPGHMVPAKIISVNRFPLTPHGKIDRDQLRQLSSPSGTRKPFAPPETATERLISAIWAEVLRVDTVSRGDDFFELGGDSLTAAVVAAKIHAALGVEVSLGEFSNHPALSDFATAVERSHDLEEPDHSPPLIRVPRGEPLPLSYEQERIWKYSQTPESSAGYTLVCIHRIRGPLDVEALRVSISDLARRHEMLRTSFHALDAGPVQVVHPPAPVLVPVIDLAQAPRAVEHAMAFLRDEARRPFDLDTLPLMRLWLVRIHQNEHWLLRINHHIICDTWSWKIYFDELRILYEARLRGEIAPLAGDEALQYGDYAVWQRRVLHRDRGDYQRAIAWWKELFADQVAPLELPFRRPEPLADADPAEALIWWGLDPAIAARLEVLQREESSTYYLVRLAAFVAVVAGDTGQTDVVLGTNVSNRSRNESLKMVGFFANLGALRFRVRLSCTFREWMRTVRHVIGETQARCQVPYEQMCAELRTAGVTPPEIRAIFAVSDQTAAMCFGGLELTWMDRLIEHMPWGFSLTFDRHNEQSRCRIDFDARIYDPEGVRALRNRFIRFLDAASRYPDRGLAQLLGESEKSLKGARPVAEEWNGQNTDLNLGVPAAKH